MRDPAIHRILVLRASDGAPRALAREGVISYLVPSLVPGEALVCNGDGGTFRAIRFKDTRIPEIDLGQEGAQ